MSTVDFDSIDRGFSAKALVYDDYGADHPVILWARAQVRQHVMSLVPPGACVLELAAGTGADAAFLAERGYRVHATDLAEGMVAETRRKIAARGLGDRMTAQRVSFTELERVTGGPYDLVFSNFGGLNCIPDLTAMTRGLPRVLKPGGFVTLVIMPPVCLWEMGQALRGDFTTAFRRLHRGGVMARVASAHFKTYYFRPGQVLRALGPGYRRVAVRGLSVFSPPPYLEKFARRHEAVFRRLTALDERLGRWPVVNAMGDFFIVTVQYLGGGLRPPSDAPRA
jgi:ubiquinone/menaquinone biosynthesis C-methylase UbiE